MGPRSDLTCLHRTVFLERGGQDHHILSSCSYLMHRLPHKSRRRCNRFRDASFPASSPPSLKKPRDGHRLNPIGNQPGKGTGGRARLQGGGPGHHPPPPPTPARMAFSDVPALHPSFLPHTFPQEQRAPIASLPPPSHLSLRAVNNTRSGHGAHP